MVALLGVLALGMAGCSASSTSSGASVADVAAPAPADRAVAGTDAAASGSAPLPSKAGVESASLDITQRQIIVNADLQVRVSDVPTSTRQVQVLAARQRATIQTQSTSSGSSGPAIPSDAKSNGCTDPCSPPPSATPYASSTTTLRVDPGRVDALLRDLSALGTVVSSSRSSDDVTAEVADVGARVSNAEASVARVRALMARAGSIGDVVALEGELSRRQGDLEALQARQRTLADQTAQASITVTLVDSGAPVQTATADTGFLAGLRAGWDAFTSALVVALTVVGALIPFLLLLLPLAAFGWWLLRRGRRAGATTEQPAPGV
jgi:hypothetical protein